MNFTIFFSQRSVETIALFCIFAAFSALFFPHIKQRKQSVYFSLAFILYAINFASRSIANILDHPLGIILHWIAIAATLIAFSFLTAGIVSGLSDKISRISFPLLILQLIVALIASSIYVFVSQGRHQLYSFTTESYIPSPGWESLFLNITTAIFMMMSLAAGLVNIFDRQGRRLRGPLLVLSGVVIAFAIPILMSILMANDSYIDSNIGLMRLAFMVIGCLLFLIGYFADESDPASGQSKRIAVLLAFGLLAISATSAVFMQGRTMLYDAVQHERIMNALNSKVYMGEIRYIVVIDTVGIPVKPAIITLGSGRILPVLDMPDVSKLYSSKNRFGLHHVYKTATGSARYVTYTYFDRKEKRLYEIGFDFRSYRAFLHPIAFLCSILIICTTLFILLLPFAWRRFVTEEANDSGGKPAAAKEAEAEHIEGKQSMLTNMNEVMILAESFNETLDFFLEHGKTSKTSADDINQIKKLSESFDLTLQHLMRMEKSRKRQLQVFTKFVPNQFLKYLDKDSIVDISLGDAVEKFMGIMFCDIRDFTPLSETMTVEETFKFLNSYLKRMVPLIKKHNGFVDKFIGDEIMALFEEGTDDAVLTAISLQLELRCYNQHRAKSGYIPIKTGIGLHCGNLMLGTVGSADRLQTTVVGDTVNLGSRLQTMSKIFKVPIIISDAIYKTIWDPEDYKLREIDSVKVKGKKKPVVIYELFDPDPENILEKKHKNLGEFHMGLILYKSGNFQDALEKFRYCYGECSGDPIAKLYIRRCQYLLKNPPGENWSGISNI